MLYSYVEVAPAVGIEPATDLGGTLPCHVCRAARLLPSFWSLLASVRAWHYATASASPPPPQRHCVRSAFHRCRACCRCHVQRHVLIHPVQVGLAEAQ
jgi:hypothetical protein